MRIMLSGGLLSLLFFMIGPTVLSQGSLEHPREEEVVESPIVKAPAHPRLGVAVEESPGGGLLVREVETGQPADLAGIRTGDRILRFDGAQMTSVEQLIGRLNRLRPGARVQVFVARGDQHLKLAVRFKGAPQPARSALAGHQRLPGRKGRLLHRSLRSAHESLERALAALARRGDPGLKEVQQDLAKALGKLDLVLKLLPGHPGVRPRAPLAEKRELPEHRMIDMRKIRERIQDLISSGAAPEEIESTLKKEFGGNIRIQVERSSRGEPEEDSEPAPKRRSSGIKVKKSKHATTRTSTSSTKGEHTTGSKTSGSRKSARAVMKRMKEEMRRLMEDLKKKQDEKKKKGDR